MEKSIKWSGVAAKGDTMEMEGVTSEDLTPTPATPSRGNQTFYFPKSPDDEQGQTMTTPVAAEDGPRNPAAETSWFDFDFGFEAGPQSPPATLTTTLNRVLQAPLPRSVGRTIAVSAAVL